MSNRTRAIDSAPTTSSRKLDHLEIALSGAAEASGAGWDEIELVHNCLPEIDLATVDTSVAFLGRTLAAPVCIVSMTGGHDDTTEINRRLAAAAQAIGVAIGVGSQRAAIERPELLRTYSVAREAAPTAFLIGNIGAPQLVRQTSRDAYEIAAVRRVAAAIGADALAVHLNFLQEACQPEGDTNASGVAAAVRALCTEIGLPVIAKETGAGMSRAEAMRLRDLGVAAIDVGGYGGSNMARIEAERAQRAANSLKLRVAQTFARWGTPTAIAVAEVRASGLPVIATGGVRSGLDAAKALNLGATLVGIGRPALAQARLSEGALVEWLRGFIEELRVAMFLNGAATLPELRTRPRLLFGRTAEWQRALASASSA
jgi:isopentenyl-diphosphate delta-isomerase